jgi:hypothetical protein
VVFSSQSLNVPVGRSYGDEKTLERFLGDQEIPAGTPIALRALTISAT